VMKRILLLLILLLSFHAIQGSATRQNSSLHVDTPSSYKYSNKEYPAIIKESSVSDRELDLEKLQGVLTAALLIIVLLSVTLLVVGVYYVRMRHKASKKHVIVESDCGKQKIHIEGFIDVALLYISRLDDFKRLVHRKVKTGQYNDLLHDNINDRERDEKEVFTLFDRSFLKLYPDFVEKINAHFKPEEQLHYKVGEPLSTEIRILALMYLGVNDNAKIAAFLHYSLRTVYNYRSQLRKKVLNEVDDIEELIGKME
jgi:hypothetical protein